MTTKIQTNSVAQEAIDFQKDGFGEKIEEFFKTALSDIADEKMLRKPYQEIKAYNEHALILSELILKRTGLNVGVTFTGAGPYMQTVLTSNGSVLDMLAPPNYDSTSATKLLKVIEAENAKNIVNIKTAKVTGVFSKLPFGLYYPIDSLNSNKLTPAEMTAVCLHEIGHAFTSLEFLSRFSTANQVLSAITRSWEEDDKSREFVYSTAGTMLSGNSKAFESFETIRDEKIITVVLIDAVKEGFVSQTGTLHADSVTSEQVADQFCARFGYARPLMSGLEKIYGAGTWVDKTKNGTRVFLNVLEGLKLSTLPVISVGAMSAGAAAVPLVVYGFLIGLLGLWAESVTNDNSPSQPKTYDDAVVRHKRMREQVIELLKDTKLNAATVKRALEDLKVMGEIITEYNTTPYKSLMNKVLTFFSKKRKTAQDASNLQRELEELSANELFAKSAQIRTINK